MEPTATGSPMEEELSAAGPVGNEESVASDKGTGTGSDHNVNHSLLGVNMVDVTTHRDKALREEEGNQFLSLSSIWQHNTSTTEGHERAKIILVSVSDLTLPSCSSPFAFMSYYRRTPNMISTI